MRVYYGFTPGEGPAAVALGCFDGLHLGHRQVIAQTAQRGLLPTVLTFQDDIFRGGKTGGELMTQPQKIRLLRFFGVQQVYFLRFSDIMDDSPREFVENVLLDVCRAQKVCCGFNFTFGRGGKGNSTVLQSLCGEHGVRVSVSQPVEKDGVPISSTRIRALVAQGEVQRAAALLGRPFSIDFEVVHGRRLGRKMGTPTLNQVFPKDFVLPRYGVYASLVHIDGRRYYGVTNVGVKPTVGADAPLAETWVPDYGGRDLYGRSLQTDLLAFVRPEQKFSGLEELRENILRDRDSARRLAQEALGRVGL